MLITNAIKSLKNGGVSYTEVQFFSDLPLAANNAQSIFIVKKPSGTYFVNRKRAGLYISDGTSWSRLGDLANMIRTVDVINNVTSTDIDKPLSAKQGRDLQNKIDDIKVRVSQSNRSQITVNSTTATTIATTSITPRSAENRIILLAYGMVKGNGSTGSHLVHLAKNGTLLYPYVKIKLENNSMPRLLSFAKMDLPQTTNEITYELKAFKNTNSASAAVYGPDGAGNAPQILAYELLG